MATTNPVIGWAACALVVGRSVATVARERKRFGDRTRVAWWADEGACKAWYAALIAPPPPKVRAVPVRSKPARTEALDVAALRRRLLDR